MFNKNNWSDLLSLWQNGITWMIVKNNITGEIFNLRQPPQVCLDLHDRVYAYMSYGETIRNGKPWYLFYDEKSSLYDWNEKIWTIIAKKSY